MTRFVQIPKPPKDLWEQMDGIRQECGLIERPENSFTTEEYAQRYGLSEDKAYHDIRKLIHSGKVRKVENCRRPCYVVVTP